MIVEQTSPFGKGALATPQDGGTDLGTKIDDEGTVPVTPQFMYNFEDEILLRNRGGSCNTPNYTLVVYYSLVV